MPLIGWILQSEAFVSLQSDVEPIKGNTVLIAFVIGGADGTAARLKSGAEWLWSLSPLTLPHGLVRVVLAEQLYRAASILGNHPYHRV